MRRVKRAAAVIFDCDSTLSAIEGIDELAAARREAVAELTDAAMRGEVALEEVYGRRLELIRPRRDRVEALARAYVGALVSDARELVAALHGEGIQVRIISGGLRPAVSALAEALDVRPEHVAAVDIRFDETGGYAGYDAASPLARSGGKLEVIEAWRREIDGPIMMVGDGVTDVEAKPAVDLFVAYAGVAEREAVVSAADVVIRSLSLAPVLPLALGGTAPRDATAWPLYERGVALLEPRYHSFLQPEE